MIAGLAILSLVADPGCSRGDRDTTALPPGVVVAIGETPEVDLRAGDSTTVTIPVLVADGYHVQSNPAGNEFYVPLQLELDPDPDLFLRFGDPTYPKGTPYHLEGSPDPLLTYEDRAPVHFMLSASPTAPPGRRRVTGNLRYQACDSRRCLFPATIPVAFSVVVGN